MNASVIKDVQYIVWVIFENFLKIWERFNLQMVHYYADWSQMCLLQRADIFVENGWTYSVNQKLY